MTSFYILILKKVIAGNIWRLDFKLLSDQHPCHLEGLLDLPETFYQVGELQNSISLHIFLLLFLLLLLLSLSLHSSPKDEGSQLVCIVREFTGNETSTRDSSCLPVLSSFPTISIHSYSPSIETVHDSLRPSNLAPQLLFKVTYLFYTRFDSLRFISLLQISLSSG